MNEKEKRSTDSTDEKKSESFEEIVRKSELFSKKGPETKNPINLIGRIQKSEESGKFILLMPPDALGVERVLELNSGDVQEHELVFEDSAGRKTLRISVPEDATIKVVSQASRLARDIPKQFEPKNDPKQFDPKYDPKYDPKQFEPKNDPKYDPKQFEPKNDPKQFEPKNDPKYDPKQFEPKNDPKQFEPKNDPKQLEPKNDPKQFEPKNDPKQFDPKLDPKQFDPKMDPGRPGPFVIVTPWGT